MMRTNKHGFSLVEVSAAVVIFTMAMGMAVTGYMFALKNTNAGDTQDELDLHVQLALESLKKDLRLSSLDHIHYYPDGPGPYTAISFPMAYDSDGDGVMEYNDDGSILWDETIVYHIRPTTPHQLVKTTFSPRDNSLTDAQRQSQLTTVVKTGAGASASNGRYASSNVIFENLLNWKISPQAGQFDAFATTEAREIVNMGYTLLDGGTHKLTFNVIGKNASSKGYKIGLDQISLSTPTIEREAEKLTVESQAGAAAVQEYRLDGASGNHHLTFPATAVGNSFTLTFDTDLWEETTFRDGAEVAMEDTSIIFDETSSPKDHVVMLKGSDYTWEATDQTGSQAYDPPSAWMMQNWVVRVMQKGSELADNGNWFSYNGKKCRLKFDASPSGNFKIKNVFIGESSASTNASMDFDEATVQSVLFAGSTASTIAEPGQSLVSDWVDMEIDKDKNYLVSYRIANSTSSAYPAIWPDARSSIAMTTMVVTNGTAATAKDKTWSDRSGIEPVSVNGVIGLAGIEASYPTSGAYESRIFDTGIAAPTYKDFTWDADVPAGTALSFKVRTGAKEDLSDASDWSLISSFSSPKAISADYKRYVQFQAVLTASSDGLSTPKLKSVKVDWDAPARLVNIGGLFAMGPEYGLTQIKVDGEPLRSALMVDLEIYKDVYSVKQTTRRISSSMTVDMTPRNTGM